jgi:CubicO group peptidase (beta-lactamase class C family)
MKKILITLFLILLTSFVSAKTPWEGYPYNSSEIPEDANPDYKILKYYLKKYIKNRQDRKGYKFKVKASKNYKKFNFNLKKDDFVNKQLNETAMLSYLMYDNGNITIDEITPEERFGKIFKNNTQYISNSVGKSLISYITGHAICKGYISGINHRLNDWSVLENTLFYDQPIINLLNMSSGSQNYANTVYGLLGSDRWVNSVSVQSVMKKELKNSEIARLRYNYSNLDTNIVASYVLYKMGHKEFKNLLNEILVDKAGIENDVWLFKQVPSSKEATLTYSYYASRYDYLRIAVAMLEDWNKNTCEGQYLKSLFENRIKKIDPSDPTAWTLVSLSDDGWGSTSTYGGQFHMDITEMEGRPIFVMDGYGGQSHNIDFENNKIISIMAIHRDYDWMKLVHQKLK